MMKAHLFYVEDDESLRFVTRDNLERQGYQLTCCSDGREALDIIQRGKLLFDLYILDVMLPEVDGFSLAREIRKYDHHTPIIFLTAKSLKEDKIHGLRIGADDYLTKPFSIEELILKIGIFLRRNRVTSLEQAPACTTIGGYTFHYDNLALSYGDKVRQLTRREAELLRLLANHKNELLTRSDILQQVWGKDDYFLGRSLDVFISRLRKYLKHDEQVHIENIHGVGFRLSEKQQPRE